MRELTKEEASRVLLKNQENIVRKAADGKVLTASEKDALTEITEQEGEDDLTAQQLANELGISRRTVFYLRKNADGPRGTDLNEWQEFLEARAMFGDVNNGDSFLPEELQKTKHRLLKAQAGKEEAVRKLREMELERRAQHLVPAAEAQEAIKKVLAPLRGALDNLPKLVAHHANPEKPLMAENAIADALQNVFKQIHEHGNKIKS